MKLGYSTWSTQKMPLGDAIRELARIGYDGVEIAVNPGWSGHVDDLDAAARRRIRQLLDDTGVELSALVSGHRNQVAEATEYGQGSGLSHMIARRMPRCTADVITRLVATRYVRSSSSLSVSQRAWRRRSSGPMGAARRASKMLA